MKASVSSFQMCPAPIIIKNGRIVVERQAEKGIVRIRCIGVDVVIITLKMSWIHIGEQFIGKQPRKIGKTILRARLKKLVVQHEDICSVRIRKRGSDLCTEIGGIIRLGADGNAIRLSLTVIVGIHDGPHNGEKFRGTTVNKINARAAAC